MIAFSSTPTETRAPAFALHLASSVLSPIASSRAKLAKGDLKLYVNGEYKPRSRASVNAGIKVLTAAELLAREIQYEFAHLANEQSITFGARVDLKTVPLDTDLHAACRILGTLGYVAKPSYTDPRLDWEPVVVSIWMEYADR